MHSLCHWFCSLPLLLDDAGLHVLSVSFSELRVEHTLHSAGIDAHHLSSREDTGRKLFRERVEKPFVNFVDVHERYFGANLADEIMSLLAAEVESFLLFVCQAGKL